MREALINALYHREYGCPSGSVTITIFDDRLEIASYGTLLPNVKIEQLKTAHASHPRNQRITNTFFRRGYIEAMGIGTQEILKACIAANMFSFAHSSMSCLIVSQTLSLNGTQ